MKTTFPNRLFHAALAMLAAVAFTTTSNASTWGTENANSAVYNDGWQSGDDGDASGNGFQGWSLAASGGTAGHFIGDSKNLAGGSGADINVSGKSFGMYGGSGSQADAYGFFNGALAVGQRFSIDLAVNYRNGYKGIDLRNDGNNATIFNFNTGGDDYVVANAATGNGTIGNSYNQNTAFHLEFTQTSTGGGTWTITRSGGVSDFDSGTYTGVPSSFKLYVGGTGGGSPNDLYANSLSINTLPVAQNLTLGVALGGAVSFTVIGGKHTPTDADGHSMTVTAVGAATSGTSGFTSTAVTYDATGATPGTNTFTYTVSDGFGGTDTKTVTVIVTAAGSGANIISLSGTVPNIAVNYAGLPSSIYAVDRSTNLTSWVELTTSATTGTNGLGSYTDTSAPLSSAYYRTRFLSTP